MTFVPDPRIRAPLIKISGSARVAASCIVVGGASVQYFAMIIIVNGRDDHNAHQSTAVELLTTAE